MERVSALYKSAAAVMLRDPLSAEFARRYGERDDSTQGVDCAFLLKPTPAFAWKGSKIQGPTRVGFSFGRGPSRVADVKAAMLHLVDAVSERLGATDRVDLKWIRANAGDPIAHVARKLEAINSCDLIITDTYHCAVNAWREGVPTVCIGFGVETPSTTVSDKKKELLYSMIQAREYYVYSEDQMPVEEKANRLVQLCTDERRCSAVTGVMHKLALRAETRLVGVISQLTGIAVRDHGTLT